MTLKRQLLVASLLMLLIPWAGLQFVLDLDDALRQQALTQLHEQAQRMSEAAGDGLIGQAPVTATTPAIYVDAISHRLEADGYPGDWPGYEEDEGFRSWQSTGPVPEPGQPALDWQAASDGKYLYLLIRIRNRQPVMYDPGAPERPYDHLELRIQPPEQDLGAALSEQSWLIRTPAPGSVYGLTGPQARRPDYRVTGSWRTTSKGWQLELQLPAPEAGSRLGFSARWSEAGQPRTLGTASTPLPRLVSRNRQLELKLAPLLNRGQQVRILEPAGWVIARQQTPATPPQAEFDSLISLQVLEQISLNALRALVRFYQPDPVPLALDGHRGELPSTPLQGLARHPDGSVWLATTTPVFGDRTLILEQSLEQLLALSGSTLGSVIARSTLFILGLTLVLLGYASWLSWRITRLQRAVSSSIDEDGRIVGTLPESSARDELGQLQRHFSQMVHRLQGYNHYLESFSRRLSHELKTPVAVVRSSLENLNQCQSDDDRRQYTDRAAAATERLSQILNGMSEAARLEQSFDHADKEEFDLAEVAGQATAAYQTLDPDHRIDYQGPPQGCTMTGSPELMVQLLDKLVDNARDFTPANGHIQVSLEPGPDHLSLTVFNEGSSLPGDRSTDIFGPFISLRDGQEAGHLGQGLLIVRLIADYHGARVEAHNGVQGAIDGVCFRVIIPTTHT